MNTRRAIPGVDTLLETFSGSGLPHAVVRDTIRDVLTEVRQQDPVPDVEQVHEQIERALTYVRLTRIQPVINGTGIIIHTNLGRSPLSPKVIDTISSIGSCYNNLEFNLVNGKRGGRAMYLERALAIITGAEAATVVNNCAAALVLMLKEFASIKPEVLISRGELVQIGGGFRVPDILETSGAKLREVGTTNKTSLTDYEQAIGPETGMILKVHRSNFSMDGFVDAPSTRELANLAEKHDVPFCEDLGSGAILPLEQLADVEHEPTPAETLQQGCQLVCVSGDKLLGGPQAGIIAGNRNMVDRVKKNQFFRALRCDKLILSALQTTVDHYLDPEPENHIPTPGMISLDNDMLTERAQSIINQVSANVTIGSGISKIGGGTTPSAVIDSVTLDIRTKDIPLKALSDAFRNHSIPIIGYVANDAFKIDLRTVFVDQDAVLVTAINKLA